MKVLTEKMTVLNIRMSVEEKEELKERAAELGDSISSYARKYSSKRIIQATT